MNKHHIIGLLTVVLTACGLTACSSDELRDESIITVDQNVSDTPFDRWLSEKIRMPYNINVEWRWNENEVILGNFTVPADYDCSIVLAHILKYCCLEAYDEVVNIDFTRHRFPKHLVFIGSWRYDNNNKRVLGTAEGGKKIWLMGVNEVMMNVNSIENLNHEYLKTMHHEFTHILNQTTPFNVAFNEITKTTYIADSWSVSPNNEGYLQRGYISAYAQHSAKEDFAEMYSIYVTSTKEIWDGYIDEAIITTTNADGTETTDYTYRDLLLKKLDLVREYMYKQWGIDMDVMREVLHRRTKDIVDGRIDLTDLTVNNN